MRKVLLSVAAIAAVSTQSFAAESLSEAFKEGKVSGQLRAFYINRNYSYEGGTTAQTTNDRDGLALGGKIGFETASVHGISAGAMFYSTNKIDSEAITANMSKNDKTLFNKDDQGYTFLGQAYMNLKAGNTNVKVGRQELNTPLAGGDDARMLPTVFEAAVLTNTDIKDTTLIGAHVTQISYGSFANGYLSSGELGLISGYGNRSDYKNGTFMSMGKAALGDSAKSSAVSVAAIVYKGLPNTTIQVWDYLAHDILNAIYAQADVSWKCLFNPAIGMTGSLQYIRESDLGSKDDYNLGGQFYAAQLAAKSGNLTLTGAYSVTPKASSHSTSGANQFKGDIITPWGGMPAFTQGMVTRHQFFNDTKAYKISANYNLKDLVPDLSATVYYASFDVKSANNYTAVGETTERGFDIIQNNAGIKNLQLRFRGNFPEDFKKSTSNGETTSWAEYRLIANYNF